MDSRLLLTVLIFSSVLLTSNFVAVGAAPFTQKDNEAKEEIITSLSKAVNNSYSQYQTIIADKHDNTSVVIYNQSEASPPPPPACPPNSFYNQTSQKCEPILPNPPVCPTGQHFNQTTQQCQDDTTIPPPPPPPTTDKPVVDVNASKYLRVAAVGDIDDNSGLVTQLNLAKKYHTKLLVVIGDYGYNSCPGVITKLNNAGFTKDNAVIIQGNHDCSDKTKAFNGWSTLYGNTNFPNINGKFTVFAIDGNSNFDCTSTQFKEMKAKIESSDAWYNIAGIHQPFVTVKSDHGPNGQFNCWNPIFHANGVNPILEAHNHNYQRFDVNGMIYDLVGTGTHDTGGSMYSIDSQSWNGFNCQKCFTGTNGILLMDFQIDDPHVKHMSGWFISNNDAVKDSFHK